MLNVFVGEPLAPGTLRQSHTFPKSTVVSLAVGGVEGVDWKSAFNAYRHFTTLLGRGLLDVFLYSCEGPRWLGARL
jgi:hypothetical protein